MKMNTLFVVAFLGATCCSLAVGKTVAFTDCGSKGGQILTVDVTPCDQEPCSFARGQSASLEFDFASTSVSSSAILKAYASVLGIKIPLTITQPDACQLFQCPLTADNGVRKVTGEIKVPKSVPFVSFSFPVRVTMTGDNNQMILCGQIKAKLKS